MSYKDKEKKKAYHRTWRHAHREQWNADGRAWKHAHPVEIKASKRAYDEAIFAQALRILGSKCACPGCEVSEPAFLTIDHINGRPKGPKKDPLHEARASGWDKTRFQILCWNCNCAKRDRGFCPVHGTASERTNGHNPGTNAQQTLWAL